MTHSPAPDFEKLLAYRTCIEQSVQAARTRQSYSAGWKRFVDWCERAGRCPFPASAETVILHLTDGLMANGKISSAKMYRNAINDAHRSARIPIPEPLAIRQFLTSAQRLALRRDLVSGSASIFPRIQGAEEAARGIPAFWCAARAVLNLYCYRASMPAHPTL